ncbi:MAG: hypothetical protein LOD91_03775 [Limnochordales bacterium]
MDAPLPVGVREPQGETPRLTVIAIHGRGSNEDDLLGLAPALGLPVRFVAPRGPLPIPLGWAQGWAWYEFANVGDPEPETFRRSLERLVALVDHVRDRYGLAREQLFVLGFSQGAVMSLATALTVPDRVGGVVALSGYLPRPEAWQPPHTDLGGMPVLVTHGTYDSILPVAWGRAAAEALRSFNAHVRYEEFPMDHEVNSACLQVIREWLAARLDGGVADGNAVPGNPSNGNPARD